MSIPEILEQLLNTDVAKMAMALLLTMPIAYDREQSTRSLGLRTFPLVALATCSYVLISLTFIDADSGEIQVRLISGLVAGIGFIGGGAILKQDDRVVGTASAASIWTTGALGVAVAHGRLDIALFLAFTTFIILRWFARLKTKIPHQDENGADKEPAEA